MKELDSSNVSLCGAYPQGCNVGPGGFFAPECEEATCALVRSGVSPRISELVRLAAVAYEQAFSSGTGSSDGFEYKSVTYT